MKPSTAEIDAAIDKLVAEGRVTREGNKVVLTQDTWERMVTPTSTHSVPKGKK